MLHIKITGDSPQEVEAARRIIAQSFLITGLKTPRPTENKRPVQYFFASPKVEKPERTGTF